MGLHVLGRPSRPLPSSAGVTFCGPLLSSPTLGEGSVVCELELHVHMGAEPSEASKGA